MQQVDLRRDLNLGRMLCGRILPVLGPNDRDRLRPAFDGLKVCLDRGSWFGPRSHALGRKVS